MKSNEAVKYTVLTSFGVNCWHSHAKRMLQAFAKYWPQEVTLAVICDPELAEYESEMRAIMGNREGGAWLTFKRTEEREKWLAETPPDDGVDYRKHYVRFSHKVWAINETMKSISGCDFVIWMDSDIITDKPVTLDDIANWMPHEGSDISYMGRKDWEEPETGFIGFRLGDEAKSFCNNWYRYYNDLSEALKRENSWTDARAFLLTMSGYKKTNLTENIEGRDVFDKSPMAEFMTHHKGPVRKKALRQTALRDDDPTGLMAMQSIDVNNMGIGTKNNMDIKAICGNVWDNLRQIDNWVDYCAVTDEPVVICSAGPSLNPSEIRPWVEKGVKIVAVKHAMDRLLDWGITPWACILLDGRSHVKSMTEGINRDVLYITASMVDPNVIRMLNKHRCMVLGYHAYVGSEIMQVLPAGALMIEGGSATSTRGINVLHTLGFRNFHIYGMDCCYLEKPDLAERKENGMLKYIEAPLECETWGNKRTKRTFWTEGQYLAQVQEMKRLYFTRKDMKIETYGDGVIPWMQKHTRLYNEWFDQQQDIIDKRIATAKTLDDLVDGINESRRTVT